MKPETVHLLAQVIRHQRAGLTSTERWIKSSAFSRDEALLLVRVWRGVLDSYEAQLSAVHVTE